MKELKIYNAFGITPTTNCVAAGLDFYVPNFESVNDMTDDKYELIMGPKGFQKSFNKTREELEHTMDLLVAYVGATKGEAIAIKNAMNLLHLYLAISSQNLTDADDPIETFCDIYLTWDNNDVPGIFVDVNDHVKFNSGIAVKLDPGYAGIFFNKSGRGTAGWDVRACVVDEDYSGFVHTSLAFTSDLVENSRIFCGDKITQMVILNVAHPTVGEVDADTFFNVLHASSERGNASFGSSNEKH